MPRTQTYDIGDERDRLQQERAETADRVIELEERLTEFDDVPDDLNREYRQALQEGHQTDRFLSGLAWAADPDEGPAIDEITLKALTAGNERWVTGRTQALADQLADKWGTDADEVDGGRVLHAAAVGIAECPRFDGDPTPEERVDIVRGWHPSFVRWVADRVDDLSTPEVQGKNFGELLKARRSDERPDSSGDGSS